MTKSELSKYAGNKFYCLASRMGGKFHDIHCLTVYRITERGTCAYMNEVMSCVANNDQWDNMRRLTGGKYVSGRPSAARLEESQVRELIKG